MQKWKKTSYNTEINHECWMGNKMGKKEDVKRISVPHFSYLQNCQSLPKTCWNVFWLYYDTKHNIDFAKIISELLKYKTICEDVLQTEKCYTHLIHFTQYSE